MTAVLTALILLSGLPASIPTAAALSPHAPIVVTGDADLLAQAANEGWPGSGATGDPIVISGYSIAAAAHAILLIDTTLHVLVQSNALTAVAGGSVWLVRAANVHIEDNDIGPGSYGIVFDSASDSAATANHISMARGGVACVVFASAARIRVNANSLEGCGSAGGVLLSASSDAAIEDNLITDPAGHGIGIAGGASGVEIVRNTVLRSSVQGILLDATNPPNVMSGVRITDNVVADGAHTGIFLARQGGGAILDTIVERNDVSGFTEAGIADIGSTRTTIAWNVIHDNRGPGIVLWDASAARIANNIVVRVASSTTYPVGIGAILGATVTIEDNALEPGAGAVGLHASAASDGIIRRNHVKDALWGILTDGRPGPTDRHLIEDNLVEGGTVGIGVAHGSDNVVQRNLVTGTSQVGIVVDGSIRPTLRNVVRENLVTGNAGSGIGEGNLLASGTLVEGNTVTDNGGHGLYSVVGANPSTFRSNVVERNLNGIVLMSRSGLRVEDNEVAGSASTGMVLFASASGNAITHNRVRGSVGQGMFIDTSTANTIWDNLFANQVNALVNLGNAQGNVFNVAPTAGTNILGGPFIAGNAWSDLVGLDVDGNGVSELPYVVIGLGIDLDALAVTTFRPDATLNPPILDNAPLMTGPLVVGPVTSAALDATLLGVLGPNAAAAASVQAPEIVIPTFDLSAWSAGTSPGGA